MYSIFYYVISKLGHHLIDLTIGIFNINQAWADEVLNRWLEATRYFFLLKRIRAIFGIFLFCKII